MSRFNNLEFGDQFEEQSQAASPVKDAQYYLAEARSSFEAGRFEEALRHYAKVLEFDPRCAAAWTGQVRMLIELGEFHEAKLWAEKALETFPTEGELLAAKAVALARGGDLEAALSFSDAAVETRGNTPYIWLARGDVLLARAEKRAEFCFEKALALAARDWFIHWLACRVYCYYRKFSRALHLAQKALEIDAARAVVWLQFGRCQLALGLPQVAAQSFERARELDPLCQPEASDLSDLSTSGPWTRLRGWCRQLFRA
ncbi:MAG: tetratricopeptide repeat protein [Verrucomicrobiota bacterium]